MENAHPFRLPHRRAASLIAVALIVSLHALARSNTDLSIAATAPPSERDAVVGSRERNPKDETPTRPAAVEKNETEVLDAARHRTNASSAEWRPTDEWLFECAESEARNPSATLALAVPTEWLHYRLGDCIKRCKFCGSKPGSLALEYKLRACPDDDRNAESRSYTNATVVDEILRLRDGVEGFVKPDPDEIVIHLRLGDVVDRSNSNVSTMLARGADPRHNKNFETAIKSAYELLSDVNASGATEVSIVGGSHYAKSGWSKSVPYARCVRKTLEAAGFEVRMRLNGANPDRDFYFMSRAKRIVVSTGGFSRLVGRNALRNGGTIVGRTF